MDALLGGGLAEGFEHHLSIALLDFDVGGVLMAFVRRAGHVKGNTPVFRRQGNLEGANLVDDPAVHGDGVGGAGKYVNLLFVHSPAGHIVGDDRNVKAHVRKDAGGEARALEIGSRLRADEFNLFAPGFTFLAHKAENGLCEALGHNGALVRELVHQVFGDFLDFAVAGVGNGDDVVKNRLYGVFLPGGERLFCGGKTALGYHKHALRCGGAGVSDDVGRLPKVVKLGGGGKVFRLVRRKDHSHSGGKVGSGALGDHILYCFGNLCRGAAGDEAHRVRVAPAVKNPHLAVFVPCDVFIFEKERKSLVGSCHFREASFNVIGINLIILLFSFCYNIKIGRRLRALKAPA